MWTVKTGSGPNAAAQTFNFTLATEEEAERGEKTGPSLGSAAGGSEPSAEPIIRAAKSTTRPVQKVPLWRKNKVGFKKFTPHTKECAQLLEQIRWLTSCPPPCSPDITSRCTGLKLIGEKKKKKKRKANPESTASGSTSGLAHGGRQEATADPSR